MSKRIINEFEPIKIEEKHSDVSLMTACLNNGLMSTIFIQYTIRQTCQRIMMGLVG